MAAIAKLEAEVSDLTRSSATGAATLGDQLTEQQDRWAAERRQVKQLTSTHSFEVHWLTESLTTGAAVLRDQLTNQLAERFAGKLLRQASCKDSAPPRWATS